MKKKINNPIEVRVQLIEAGRGVIRALVESSLHLSAIDSRCFGVEVLRNLAGDVMEFRSLHDGSFISVSASDDDCIVVGDVPHRDAPLSFSAGEFELQDGQLHLVDFVLAQLSSDPRRDYTTLGTRTIRLLGVATVEVDCDEEEAVD